MKNYWLERVIESRLKISKNIIVNGYNCRTNLKDVDYWFIVRTKALFDGISGGLMPQDVCYSILYFNGVDGEKGILRKGQSVDVTDGMVFNVCSMESA